jgi:DNA-binding transcriptional LysR family regulator
VAPSVITKRISQLEKALGTRLVNRSTRGLTLTTAAESVLPRFVRLVAEFDELFKSAAPDDQQVDGNLRIKSPTTVTTEFLGSAYTEFLQLNASVDLEIVLVDRSVNPLEEGFDCAIGALPVSYPNVIDIPLCPYELVVCCAPSYLRGKAEPRHPTDLVDFECLTTTLFRTSWLFNSPRRARHARGRAARSGHRRAGTVPGRGRYSLRPAGAVAAGVSAGCALAQGAGAAHEDESTGGARIRHLPQDPARRRLVGGTPAGSGARDAFVNRER